MSTKVLHIDSSYFNSGVVIVNGRVKNISPILNYMRNWNEDKIRKYCEKKGWTISETVIEN